MRAHSRSGSYIRLSRRPVGVRARGRWWAMFAALLVACGDAGRAEAPATRPEGKVAAVDAAGEEVHLPRPARRVVSLLPAGTDVLFALGAGERVVGRTRHDRAPEAAHLPSVGGGLDPSLEALVALRPDLVIAWGPEKSAALRRQLEAAGISVFAARARDTADVFANIQRIGHLVGQDSAAGALAGRIRDELKAVSASVAGRPRPRALYVVWPDPPTIAGPRTFVAQVLEIAGGRTVFPEVEADWPKVSLEEVVRRDPDVIVLPVGDGEAHSVTGLQGAPGWSTLRAVREGRIVEIPADLMNRPGPHLGEAARALRDALHPDAGGR